MIKKIVLSILIILSALIMIFNLIGGGWIIYHEGSFKGKVIDTETKEPIEGAVVVAIYNVEMYGFIESPIRVVDAKEVLTNNKGEFYIPIHFFLYLYPIARKDFTDFLIYKPGYKKSSGPDYIQRHPNGPIIKPDIPTIAEVFKKGVTVDLLKLKTREERIRNIPGGIDDMRSWKLPNLFKAINEEGKQFGFEEVR